MTGDIVPHVSFSPLPTLQHFPSDTGNFPLRSQSARTCAEIGTARDAGAAMPLRSAEGHGDNKHPAHKHPARAAPEARAPPCAELRSHVLAVHELQQHRASKSLETQSVNGQCLSA